MHFGLHLHGGQRRRFQAHARLRFAINFEECFTVSAVLHERNLLLLLFLFPFGLGFGVVLLVKPHGRPAQNQANEQS